MTTRTLVAAVAAGTLMLPGRLPAQEAPPDVVASVRAAREAVVRFGRAAAADVWPGYRPDTIPVSYVLPGRGTLLLGWRGALPAGFRPVEGVAEAAWLPEADRAAANTSRELGGRAAAQVVVSDLDVPSLAGLSAHEAFHVYERGVQREGTRFGNGENAFFVSQYPVFDPGNEALVALEGRILRAALDARSSLDARRLAVQFLAVREHRQRVLGAELAEFEVMAELNEGTAEYALVRAQAFLGDSTALRDHVAGLDSLTAVTAQSLRLRFYRTGPAIALLLDRLAPPGWQARVMSEDLTLQEALALAVGYRSRENALRSQAARQFDLIALQAGATTAVAALRRQRRRQADSVLARPGIRVTIVGRLGQCGFDPQNTLRVDSTTTLHTRWLHVCGGSGLDGEFTTPVVVDDARQTLAAVVGSAAELRLAARGVPIVLDSLTGPREVTDLSLGSPGLTLRAARASIERDAAGIRVVLIR
jgi:hypothetical protein